MKPKCFIPLDMRRELYRMRREYETVYRVQIPGQTFFEMILSLGFESMSSVLAMKTDSMKMEVNEK